MPFVAKLFTVMVNFVDAVVSVSPRNQKQSPGYRIKISHDGPNYSILYEDLTIQIKRENGMTQKIDLVGGILFTTDPLNTLEHTHLWFRQGLFNPVEGLAVVSIPA